LLFYSCASLCDDDALCGVKFCLHFLFRVFGCFCSVFEAQQKERKRRVLHFPAHIKERERAAVRARIKRERESRDALELFPSSVLILLGVARKGDARAFKERNIFARYSHGKDISFRFKDTEYIIYKECPLSSLSPGRRRYHSRRRTRVDARVTLARASGRQRLDFVGIIIPRKCPPPRR